MPLIRVLLVEDHTIVRAGLRSLLESLLDVEVVAETGDGREALSLIGQHQPDVALMDIAVPGLNGLEVTARTVKEWPQVRVIILSMYGNEEYVLHALRAGASGYLLKDTAMPELEFALRAVVGGETYLSPPVSKHVINNYVQRTSGEGGDASPLEKLTPRQREVLQLIVEGYSTQRIAQTLTVSIKTVETHRMQLMDRLGIHDIAGLVRFAVQVGVVPPNLPGAP